MTDVFTALFLHGFFLRFYAHTKGWLQ